MPWTENSIPDQAGRTAIVTGGATGLGAEVGRALALKGARVILAGRNAANGAAVVARTRALRDDADIRFEMLDLADLSSVRDFVARIDSSEPKLDVLVNNAGVAMPPMRIETRDGFELQFAVNYLGHFLLTADLLPKLRAGSGARVVNVSSLAHFSGRLHFDDLNAEQTYDGPRGYGQSKLAMIMFAREFQRRSKASSWGVLSNAAHPGFATTELVENGKRAADPSAGRNVPMAIIGALIGHSPAHGALPLLYAAVEPSAGEGYYGPNGIFGLKGFPGQAVLGKSAQNDAEAERLWTVSTTLTGAVWPN